MGEKRNVRLGGELGEKFVKEFAAYVDSVAEAIRMLEANWPGFAQHLRESDPEKVGYRVTVADRDVAEDEIVLVSQGDILIMPVIVGASAGVRFLAGAAILAFSWWNPLYWSAAAVTAGYGVGASMMIGGAIQLLTPIPKQPDWQAKDGKPNYWFNGAQQTSAQGLPIPIGVGTMLIAGTVISAGVSVEDIGTGALPTNSPVLV
ncbi:phage tail protein [Chromobacterium sp. ATCC 53434]|uniref:tail assembly protein n=1 Tax=Chromobacterium TaxID=535 RepID=UPI000C757B20|nr:tail assembly protein [Chromobacterium sp. ATCC 53434]AUH51260.1 phage tail protein [Chromobacterium sp. ATCC 53434]